MKTKTKVPTMKVSRSQWNGREQLRPYTAQFIAYTVAWLQAHMDEHGMRGAGSAFKLAHPSFTSNLLGKWFAESTGLSLRGNNVGSSRFDMPASYRTLAELCESEQVLRTQLGEVVAKREEIQQRIKKHCARLNGS
jgi:hypothetical protein